MTVVHHFAILDNREDVIQSTMTWPGVHFCCAGGWPRAVARGRTVHWRNMLPQVDRFLFPVERVGNPYKFQQSVDSLLYLDSFRQADFRPIVPLRHIPAIESEMKPPSATCPLHNKGLLADACHRPVAVRVPQFAPTGCASDKGNLVSLIATRSSPKPPPV